MCSQAASAAPVLEVLSNAGITTPVVRIGWPDQFIEHGKPDDLRAKYGISVKAASINCRPYLQSRPTHGIILRDS